METAKLGKNLSGMARRLNEELMCCWRHSSPRPHERPVVVWCQTVKAEKKCVRFKVTLLILSLLNINLLAFALCQCHQCAQFLHRLGFYVQEYRNI